MIGNDAAGLPVPPDVATDPRERLERYETILETIRDAVYTLDADGRITWVNEVAVEEFDLCYGREDLVGEYVSVVLDDRDIQRVLEVISDLLGRPDVESGKCEVTLRGADGTEIPAELHLTPIRGDDGEFRGTVGVIRDVSGRKRREQRLAVLQRVLRHNVRNETNAILGWTRILQEGLSREGDDPVARIRRSARRLNELSEKARRIEDYLQERATHQGPVDAAELVRERVAASAERYPAASVDHDVPETAWTGADEMLGIALDELVENAVVHGDEEPRIRFVVRDGDDAVEVRVEDDGPGIPRAEREAVLAGDEHPLEHASGLGLWLVAWFVDSHDGDLSFGESDLGGASVRLVLPAVDPRAEDPGGG